MFLNREHDFIRGKPRVISRCKEKIREGLNIDLRARPCRNEARFVLWA